MADRVRGVGCLSQKTLSILRGQLISVFIAGTGVFASLLSSATPNALFPQFMNTLNYVLLSSYFFRRIFAGRELWSRSFYKVLSRRALAGVSASNASATDGEAFPTSSVSKALHTGDDEDDGARDTAEVSNFGSPVVSGGVSSNVFKRVETANGIVTAVVSQKLHFGWYILAAILDVEGNYLFIKAYDYTSITSIMLLDCFTIPSAMLLSYLFMGARYKRVHIVGICICIAGLICCVVSDVIEAGRTSSSSSSLTTTQSQQVLGDMLCILGSVMYASCNVLQEKLVKQGTREHYLGNVGVCGIFIAGVQFLILDLPRLRSTTLSTSDLLSIGGFVSCLFFMYTNTSSFLQNSDAVLFNLSLLTSDVYAVIFSYFRNGHLVAWLYFLAFALVAVGLFTYYSEPVVEPGAGCETVVVDSAALDGENSSVQESSHNLVDISLSDSLTQTNAYNPLQKQQR